MKQAEFSYLVDFIVHRLNANLNGESHTEMPAHPTMKPPPFTKWSLHVPKFIARANLEVEEITLLLLAICPHIYGHLLDTAIHNGLNGTGDYPQIGGIRGKNFRGFLPTGETALFLLAGDDLEKRKALYSCFEPNHFFGKHRILWLEDPPDGDPAMSGRIAFSKDYVELMIRGKISRPQFSMKFPAQIIETEMEWDDLVLAKETASQIEELQTWITHGDTLMNEWRMSKKLKPGYRVLFHGPPGTGKTLTATLLGKQTGRAIFKIDLSMVVSKFIGETEKNLANLLAKAEKTENILFFDEADALFGKRTNVRDAHDKYANQEVSYLLQRIENYRGLVILASNLKSNIDDAFVRRFQSIVHFPLPKSAERLLLWQKAFPTTVRLHKDVNLHELARKYELSGAEIMNIVQYACLCALADKKKTIYPIYLANGVQREFQKGGRIMR